MNQTAWVFDIDGVITNIKKEIITEPLILNLIIKILEKGEPVAFNTGRGIDWTQTTTLNPLVNKISNKHLLKNLFTSAESGGVSAIFAENGSLDIKIDESLKMPNDLDQKVRELVNEKYSKTMRYEDKKTMSTTKIKEGTSIEDYHKDQKEIAKDLQKIIDSSKSPVQLKVDVSTIGTAIMYETAGKDKGVELILEWLSDREIQPQKFITFGDSISSDILMAQEIYSQGFSVEFVYVGEENIDTSNYPFPIKQTKNKFEKGTLEFLESLRYNTQH